MKAEGSDPRGNKDDGLGRLFLNDQTQQDPIEQERWIERMWEVDIVQDIF